MMNIIVEKAAQHTLEPVINGPGNDKSFFVAPARTVLTEELDTKL